MTDPTQLFDGEEGQLASVLEALDASGAGTFVLDSDRTVVWANRTVEEFFGLSPENVIGEHNPSLVDSELKHRFEEPGRAADRLLSADDDSQPDAFECHVLPSETSEDRWLLHRSTPIEDGQYAGGRVEQYTDITGRKRQESATAASRRKFETIFEHANDAIFIVDVENDAIVDCNPAAEDLVEFSSEELRSMPASDLHPHNLSAFMEFADEVFEQGYGWTDDITCYCKSGDIIPAEMSASVVELDGRPHLVNHIRNTTDREEREWFEALIEHSSDLITVVKPDGTVHYQSPSVDHVLGYTPDEFRDMSFLSCVHPDDRSQVAAILEQVAYDEENVTQRREYRFRRADGSWAWLESVVSHRPDAAISGYVINSREITSRKESQQQATVLHRMLRHNLRNELNLILGHAEELAAAEDEQVVAHAERILDSASELHGATEHARLLSDIVETSRWTQQHHEVPDLIEQTVASLEEIDPEVTFDLDLPAEQSVTAAPNLKMALDQVLRNAVEHNDADDPRVEVRVQPPSETEYVEVTVADNGPGIPDQEQTVLLEGEETPLRHGSGLGLWVVNWIIARSGGRIAVDENEPRGSRVRLGLPPTD